MDTKIKDRAQRFLTSQRSSGRGLRQSLHLTQDEVLHIDLNTGQNSTSPNAEVSRPNKGHGMLYQIGVTGISEFCNGKSGACSVAGIFFLRYLASTSGSCLEGSGETHGTANCGLVLLPCLSCSQKASVPAIALIV